jgi:hypothetical protein
MLRSLVVVSFCSVVSTVALGDQPFNYGTCQGINKNALNQTAAPGPSFSSIYAQISPSQMPGPLGSDFAQLGNTQPNARSEENLLFQSNLGCGGLKPGNGARPLP